MENTFEEDTFKDYSPFQLSMLEELAKKSKEEKWSCTQFIKMYNDILLLEESAHKVLIIAILARNLNYENVSDCAVSRFVKSPMFDRNVLKIICEYSGKDIGDKLN